MTALMSCSFVAIARKANSMSSNCRMMAIALAQAFNEMMAIAPFEEESECARRLRTRAIALLFKEQYRRPHLIFSSSLGDST